MCSTILLVGIFGNIGGGQFFLQEKHFEHENYFVYDVYLIEILISRDILKS